MFMELPAQFELSFAKVANGKLLISQLIRFEDVMYELTYACKKRECVYCGKKLNRKNSTLDHRYPRDTGGISITNNLFPCCPDCNSRKTNLTHEEYLKICTIYKNEKKEYLNNIRQYNKKTMREIGFKLPMEWVTYEKLKNIHYQQSRDNLRGKKYHKIVGFYQQYKKLPWPVIVDKNNWLLDGYNTILFAKDFEIQQIPVIKLENVEFVGKKS